MKKVIFVRHAKSSWADPSLRDFDRPLNKRGLRDAPFMAKVLRGKLDQLDLIVASPANRAFTTATYFAEAFDIPVSKIRQEQRLYHAYPNDLLKLVQQLEDALDTVLVFGHNPGFTDFANHFTDDYIDNVPTCGIFQLEADIQHWADFDKSKVRLMAFHYPKQYFS
jgi:phosphohistidine phosphatase